MLEIAIITLILIMLVFSYKVFERIYIVMSCSFSLMNVFAKKSLLPKKFVAKNTLLQLLKYLARVARNGNNKLFY